MQTTPTRRRQRPSRCTHEAVSTFVIAGIRRERCTECGRLTIAFAEPAALGRTVADIRREFEETRLAAAV